jgi:flagellar hook-associated protein 2
MASVNGVSGSNMNALYGSRNVMSGLASGLDTESMIENSIAGFRLKISNLQQKQTKLEWKQTAYRSLTDKMVQFSQKYTSYTSATNLLSPSFFNRAVLTTSNGENASKVSASGRTSSTVAINGVAQLASASRYEVAKGRGVLGSVEDMSSGKRFIQATSTIQLDGKVPVSTLSGSISLTYGNQSITLNLDSTVYEDVDAFAAAINEKLKGERISFTGGSSTSADQAISVTVEDGKIAFGDRKGNNEVYISGVSGSLEQTFLGVTFDKETKVKSLDFTGKALKTEVDRLELLADKEMTFTLDDVKRTIKLPSLDVLKTQNAQDLTQYLQDQLAQAFGAGRITVDGASTDPGEPNTLQLKFTVENPNSTLIMTSTANSALGLEPTATSYLNTSRTLGDLLGSATDIHWDEELLAVGKVTQKGSGSEATFWDAQGNRVAKREGEDTYYRVDTDGETRLTGHNLSINGVVIGGYAKDTALETVLRDINNNVETGVSVSYSKMSNQFVFTSKETGSAYSIKEGSIGDDSLGKALFGEFTAGKYVEGKDSIVNLKVNDSDLTITRSSNTFDVDGLSVTVSGTFNGTVTGGVASFDPAGDPVTFTTKADADKIVEAVKAMVQDYNTMITELREAFRTMPAQKANGSKYEPLTESDLESMSETAITNYEEKAKQGLLFGDQDLSAMYDQLLRALSPGGADGVALRNMGIGTGYSQGLTTIEFDETKFREALSKNPDEVRDAFTKVAGDGSTTNGIMMNLQSTLKTYASVEGTKGILINKAGSKYSATSLLQNYLKDEIDSYETQVSKWQDKMSSKVDYYTRQFTRLEKLINQMNSQSSSLMNLMGGASS